MPNNKKYILKTDDCLLNLSRSNDLTVEGLAASVGILYIPFNPTKSYSALHVSGACVKDFEHHDFSKNIMHDNIIPNNIDVFIEIWSKIKKMMQENKGHIFLVAGGCKLSGFDSFYNFISKDIPHGSKFHFIDNPEESTSKKISIHLSKHGLTKNTSEENNNSETISETIMEFTGLETKLLSRTNALFPSLKIDVASVRRTLNTIDSNEKPTIEVLDPYCSQPNVASVSL